jgi:hypothetical protein
VPEDRATPNLTLIEGTAEDADFGLAPHGIEEGAWGARSVERSLSRRPGDHVELWTFANSAALEPIRREARVRGLNADTGIALVAERRLILADLRQMGRTEAESLLDASGAQAQPTTELWAAHHAYLRHLIRGEACERSSKSPLRSPRAALPTRLIDRLLGHDVFEQTTASSEELGLAVEWEIAALYRGELMGEWAYRSAMQALAGDVITADAR